MTKFKDVAHLYLGCKCQIESAFEDEPEPPKKFNLTIYNLNYYRGYIAGIKPFLRPLSSMTEDELIEVIQLTAPKGFENMPKPEDYDLEMFYNDGGLQVDKDVSIGANYTCICYDGQIAIRECGSIHLYDEDGNRESVYNMPEIYTYLLSKHFDIFNLIKNNEAISDTTNTTEQQSKKKRQ